MTFRADLHCHTHCSDGSDSPEAVLRKAKEIGLSGLSITDHDTIDAYSPELFALAEELNIRLLPGIELSTEYEHNTIHILGYQIDLHSPELQIFLVEMIQRRKARNEAILVKLRKKGFVVELPQGHSIGRPHIAQAMVKKGYVNSVPEAFERYLAEGASCYSPGFKYTPAEAISEIHKAGGKAVLAHPHFLKSGSLLKHLLSLPLDGLECYYGTLHKTEEKRWIDLAKKHGLIATGGSDYHGLIKPHVSLGCSWVDLETFNRLSTKGSVL